MIAAPTFGAVDPIQESGRTLSHMLDRYFWGNPYPFLFVWTALALLPVPWLVAAMAAPIPAACFEYCELGQRFATMGLLLLSELWLFVWLAVAWVWHERKPMIATVSAIGASLALAILALFVYKLISVGPMTQDLRQFAWVLSLGLQLPPVWRLARRQPSTPLRFVVMVMGVVVAVAALSSVLFGTNVAWSSGPTIVFFAWVVFVVGLLIVSVRAWRHGTASPQMVAPLLAGTLLILFVAVAVVFPGDIVYIALLEVPLSAAAWLWVAIAWLRGHEADAAPRTALIGQKAR